MISWKLFRRNSFVRFPLRFIFKKIFKKPPLSLKIYHIEYLVGEKLAKLYSLASLCMRRSTWMEVIKKDKIVVDLIE